MAYPFTGVTPVHALGYWDYLNVSVSGTSSASQIPCIFGGIIVNGGTMGALVIRDSLNASGGNVIANIATPSGNTTYDYNVRTGTGLAIFASAATNYTLKYLK